MPSSSEVKTQREKYAADLQFLRDEMQDFALNVATGQLSLKAKQEFLETKASFIAGFKEAIQGNKEALSPLEYEELNFFELVILMQLGKNIENTLSAVKQENLIEELSKIKLEDLLKEISENNSIDKNKRSAKFKKYTGFLLNYAAQNFANPSCAIKADTLYNNIVRCGVFADDIKTQNIQLKIMGKMEREISSAYGDTEFSKKLKLESAQIKCKVAVLNMWSQLEPLQKFADEAAYLKTKKELEAYIKQLDQSTTKEQLKAKNELIKGAFRQISDNLIAEITRNADKEAGLHAWFVQNTEIGKAKPNRSKANPERDTKAFLMDYLLSERFLGQLYEPYSVLFEDFDTVAWFKGKLAARQVLAVPPASNTVYENKNDMFSVLKSTASQAVSAVTTYVKGRRNSSSAISAPTIESDNKEARTLIYRSNDAQGSVVREKLKQMQNNIKMENDLANAINAAFVQEVISEKIRTACSTILGDEIQVTSTGQSVTISISKAQDLRDGFSYTISQREGENRFSIVVDEPTGEKIILMENSSNASLFYRYAIAEAIAKTLGLRKVITSKTHKYVSALEAVVKAEVAAEMAQQNPVQALEHKERAEVVMQGQLHLKVKPDLIDMASEHQANMRSKIEALQTVASGYVEAVQAQQESAVQEDACAQESLNARVASMIASMTEANQSAIAVTKTLKQPTPQKNVPPPPQRSPIRQEEEGKLKAELTMLRAQNQEHAATVQKLEGQQLLGMEENTQKQRIVQQENAKLKGQLSQSKQACQAAEQEAKSFQEKLTMFQEMCKKEHVNKAEYDRARTAQRKTYGFVVNLGKDVNELSPLKEKHSRLQQELDAMRAQAEQDTKRQKESQEQLQAQIRALQAQNATNEANEMFLRRQEQAAEAERKSLSEQLLAATSSNDGLQQQNDQLKLQQQQARGEQEGSQKQHQQEIESLKAQHATDLVQLHDTTVQGCHEDLDKQGAILTATQKQLEATAMLAQQQQLAAEQARHEAAFAQLAIKRQKAQIKEEREQQARALAQLQKQLAAEQAAKAAAIAEAEKEKAARLAEEQERVRIALEMQHKQAEEAETRRKKDLEHQGALRAAEVRAEEARTRALKEQQERLQAQQAAELTRVQEELARKQQEDALAAEARAKEQRERELAEQQERLRAERVAALQQQQALALQQSQADLEAKRQRMLQIAAQTAQIRAQNRK